MRVTRGFPSILTRMRVKYNNVGRLKYNNHKASTGFSHPGAPQVSLMPPSLPAQSMNDACFRCYYSDRCISKTISS
jgi:hypothetical protein